MSPSPPPTLVYDDDCGVCTRAARFVDRRAAIDIIGFSELTPELRDRLPAEYEQCAHLVTERAVYSCGEAMERAYELTGLPPSRLLPLFRRIPGYESIREGVYRIVAENRPLISRLLP
ncbi:putative thiol-disulphide oxidoreductase DCC (plasmid) [Haloterrigena turkmenica DSM 5511]|uniref:Thiol-disulphide oxidoreductase DCC n=1 Tax=Haloterrigena turkmenica (strain ATCC 51198 / DSM 5511 / JCM 9101 / NCIMB 13204 / VKM B-1734 / 4k) TaxID=543526 RepID=D2S181_HALTV|nr:DUF393 domain-containing protein [Haloterrigena turkmenica]ADB63128.1 putative thiol-disulphide oxidoreductase DCC [Haloterrigena turkmenica DSM 5511]